MVRADEPGDQLAGQFRDQVRPFLNKYCLDCHGQEQQEAEFNLSGYTNLQSVTSDAGHWKLVLDRLEPAEMPPEDASAQPSSAEREAVVDWIKRMRKREADRNAGDPGLVLARRLSNAEYDYTIHDLTGVDIQPTREFPVDPANEAGFTNSGESLAMTPARLQKYLGAARFVAEHAVLTPKGIEFAPHSVVTEPDRDKYCVHRIVDFYQRQPVDLADYFFAAWRYRHRTDEDQSLADVARVESVSAKYLETVWQLLTDGAQNTGPLAELRERWNALPAPDDGNSQLVRDRSVALRDFVVAAREEWIPPIDRSATMGLPRTLQPVILWINQQGAANRRKANLEQPEKNVEADDDQQIRDAVVRFCSVFPDRFFVSERGRTFLDPKRQNKGRLLSAGFHLMVGYFRDDQPLYDLVLNEEQQQQLDDLWLELDCVTRAPFRQFRDFIYFERAESTAYLTGPEFDFARSEDDDVTSAEKMNRMAKLFVARAEKDGIDAAGLMVLEVYFQGISAHVRKTEKALAESEAKHLEALSDFAQRAWRRELNAGERQSLREFYESLREQDGLNHQEAIRDVIASILVSPRFSYRVNTPPEGTETRPLDDVALANRLSYFLWSSMPDQTLLDRASAGKLQSDDALIEETRRMLNDEKMRRMAIEFVGNWLDFRQFQQHNAVDRNRFPVFTNDLRQAMFEEPVQFMVDLIQRDGRITELLDADHTFVNQELAKHYGMNVSFTGQDDWIRVDEAHRFGRGGILPMSVFLTKNSPGRRTSPVKRGYWVVRKLLGEHIPAPPADVPELPEDESQLGELSLREVLEQHRSVKSCAGCHQRFDSIGLVFEGYGPIGEQRQLDLGGRPIDDRAEFPDGSDGAGLKGLRTYLVNERQDDFVDTFCRKMLAYALGRNLALSDESTLEQMRSDLENHDYRFGKMIETIVLSPQFRNVRGRDYGAGIQ